MTKDVFTNLAKLVGAHLGHVVELRHKLHRVPEPGFCETRTVSLIAEELGNLDLDIRTGIGETGITADLVTGRSGAYVAVRADMDGLPLKESTGAEYTSENGGYAHCCGHDGHAAALVGAARVLSQIRDQLVGKVRFIFQPAEEICRGAGAMIRKGVFEPDLPDAILGVHAWPGLPTDVRRLGALAAITQAAMAAYQDEFNAGAARTVLNPAYIDQNRWKAMRHGLDGRILDPSTGEVLSTREQLERLLDSIGPKAEELGSTPYMTFARRMLEEGTEAEWQIRTCERLGGDLRALALEIAKQTLGRERLGTTEQVNVGDVR